MIDDAPGGIGCDPIIMGQPWHGLATGDQLALPNGQFLTLPTPVSSGWTRLFRHPTAPGDTRPQQDIDADLAAGREYRNYDILNSHYCGAITWLWIDSAGAVWRVEITVATVPPTPSPVPVLRFTRYGQLGGAYEVIDVRAFSPTDEALLLGTAIYVFDWLPDGSRALLSRRPETIPIDSPIIMEVVLAPAASPSGVAAALTETQNGNFTSTVSSSGDKNAYTNALATSRPKLAWYDHLGAPHIVSAVDEWIDTCTAGNTVTVTTHAVRIDTVTLPLASFTSTVTYANSACVDGFFNSTSTIRWDTVIFGVASTHTEVSEPITLECPPDPGCQYIDFSEPAQYDDYFIAYGYFAGVGVAALFVGNHFEYNFVSEAGILMSLYQLGGAAGIHYEHPYGAIDWSRYIASDRTLKTIAGLPPNTEPGFSIHPVTGQIATSTTAKVCWY